MVTVFFIGKKRFITKNSIIHKNYSNQRLVLILNDLDTKITRIGSNFAISRTRV